MKYQSFLLRSCLVGVCFLTGCESIVKDAKPPEQYLDSQVLDGNFIDFSDPEQVYALYKAHYDSLQGNKEYTSYSELRGGEDIFSIDPEWSKNFINFDVVTYDRDKGNLVYAFMTTNRSKSDAEYEYTADAEVTIDETVNADAKKEISVHATEKITENKEEDAFLVAAVCFYNQKTKTTKTIFSSIDTHATRADAGVGSHSLVAKAVDDTIAVFYGDQIFYYNYDPARATYIKKQSYNMTNLYTAKSFTDSASAYGFTAGNGTFTIHDIRYDKNGSGSLAPVWVQLEYSEPTSNSAPESSSDDLEERLKELEKNAETNINQGTKWLDVDLSMESVEKGISISISSQVTINSQDGITSLMNAERERIKQEIADNNEKYRIDSDVTRNITEQHIEDLQTVITASEKELEEKEKAEQENAENGEDKNDTDTSETTAAVSKYSNLSARFCTKDLQTDSDLETIVDTGPTLLATYKKIYDCQEKLKQQETYINACQYLKENEVYDQMLKIMSQKLDSYAINSNLDEAAKTKLSEALTRQMINRELTANTGEQGIAVDEQMLPDSMIGDAAKLDNWNAFLDQTMNDPEKASLAAYLLKNKDDINKKLSQTITDLETLMPLAKAADELTESNDVLAESDSLTSSEAESSVDFYAMGYEQILANYKKAKTALADIVFGGQSIQTYRTELSNAEDEEIQICRFDLEISEERKTTLLEECDRMEKLLKTIYNGGSDTDRTSAEKELNATKWQIDVDYQVINGTICYTQTQLSLVVYSQVVWTSTVTDVSDAHNSYVFGSNVVGLFFDESESRVKLICTGDHLFTKIFYVGMYQSPEHTYGSAFFENMDQALIASVRCAQTNTSNLSGVPANNTCELILLSQSEEHRTGNQSEDPKWSFMAVPYTKFGLDRESAIVTLTDGLGMNFYVSDYAKYGFTANMGRNNEMTYTKTVTDYATAYKSGINTNVEIRDLDELAKEEEQELTSVDYQIKVRGMLREGNTIFLDNPKIDYGTPGNSRYYFLNLSLDEGIQLYVLKPGDGVLERQKAFQIDSLKDYTEGCWFKGWWYPDDNTTYNDQGNLGGGKLVLLGLTKSDMEKFSTDENGSIRDLVADDIYHSNLYEISISADQMNACKK